MLKKCDIASGKDILTSDIYDDLAASVHTKKHNMQKLSEI